MFQRDTRGGREGKGGEEGMASPTPPLSKLPKANKLQTKGTTSSTIKQTILDIVICRKK